MGLLARYRRPWVLVVLGLLAMPMLGQVMERYETLSGEEARVLSPAPGVPRSLGEWRAFSRAHERFLADHFGFRTELVRAHGILRYALLLPTDLRVIVGRDKWLFLNGDGTIEQAVGRLLRRAAIDKFAEFAKSLHMRLRDRDARLVVAIPPNGTTINRSRLPAWAAERPAVSEYDLMMAALASRGVPAVDLRVPLLAANSAHPTYRRTDTHWNKLGALVAYNAVVNGIDPDWAIEPERVLRGFEPAPGGDLARLLAVAADVDDEDAIIDLSPYGLRAVEVSPVDTQFESGGMLIETGRSGPTVLVIGDSFTQEFWQDYFALHAGRYLWIHHEQCRFAASILEAYKPEVVVLAPTERLMFCN